MDTKQIWALVILSISAALGFIGFVIGAANYTQCSNGLGIWLVAMGTITLACSLSTASTVETRGVVSDINSGWFDLILILFLFSFNIWGTVVISQTSLNECSQTMFSFSEFAVGVAWFISLIILAIASLKFRDLVTSQKQQLRNTSNRV